LRKKQGQAENSQKSFPQGLKPGLYFEAFAARLKSCPFKTRHQVRFFRDLWNWIDFIGLRLRDFSLEANAEPFGLAS